MGCGLCSAEIQNVLTNISIDCFGYQWVFFILRDRVNETNKTTIWL